MSEGTNRNLLTRNTQVQLLAMHTDLRAIMHKSYRQTDDVMMPIADHIYCVAVRSDRLKTSTVIYTFSTHFRKRILPTQNV